MLFMKEPSILEVVFWGTYKNEEMYSQEVEKLRKEALTLWILSVGDRKSEVAGNDARCNWIIEGSQKVFLSFIDFSLNLECMVFIDFTFGLEPGRSIEIFYGMVSCLYGG